MTKRLPLLLLTALMACNGDTDDGSTDTASTDSGSGTECAPATTVDLVQGPEAGILEARLCYAPASGCEIVSGVSTGPACEPLAARWGRNEGVNPVNVFIDTLPFQSFEDVSQGTLGNPAFSITDIPLDTEVTFTVVTGETDTVRLEVPFTMTTTNITIGPVVEL